MIVSGFDRYETPACDNCKCSVPEVMVPWEEGAIPMCWLCAHAVTHHEAPLHAPLETCSCRRDEIYPTDIIARRLAIGAGPYEPESPTVVVPPPPIPLPRKDTRDFRARALGDARAQRVEALRALPFNFVPKRNTNGRE